MDPEVYAKVVIEGVLMKLGDVILMHSPSAVKKGFVVVVVLLRRRFKKKKRKEKRDDHV